MESKQIEFYFQQIESGREAFYQFIKKTVEEPWKRPRPDKWSVAETIHHLILMVRFVRKFSYFYIPIMMPYAKMRKKQPYKIEIHNIYAEYHQMKRKPMKAAPFILTPSKNLHRKYEFTELQELLMVETMKWKEKLTPIDEAVAGHIRYPDPIAYYPNVIQSIHLLAIHEEHHFNLTRKYELVKIHRCHK